MIPLKATPVRSLAGRSRSAWGWLTLFFVATYFAISPTASPATAQKYSAHEYVSTAIDPVELSNDPIPSARKQTQASLPAIARQEGRDNFHSGSAEPALTNATHPLGFTPLQYSASDVVCAVFVAHRFFSLAQPRAPPTI